MIRRHAFTLFEVAVAMLVFAVAMLACLSLLPAGMRIQQVERQRIYAATLAMTYLDTFHKPIARFQDMGRPSLRWDVRFTDDGVRPDPARAPTGEVARFAANVSTMLPASGAFAPDLEQMIVGPHTGAFPVPLEIARRIDSDGDEIRRILDGGGLLYAIDPSIVRGSSSSRVTTQDRVAFGEELMRNLVFAVVGAPQQNALPAHPQGGWPWYEKYPFPPQWKASGGVTSFFQARTYTGTELTARRNDRDLLGTANEGDITTGPGAFAGITISPATGDLSARSGWHGGNWEYFATTRAGSPWANGWPAFQALAGDPRCGWLAIQSLIHPAGGQYVGAVTAETTAAITTVYGQQPTYEMRAAYRDRAIRLWQAVRPRPASIPAIDEHPLILGTPSLRVADSLGNLHRVSYGPAQLDRFTTIDPWSLNDGSGDFPPHPAQILALSYLAHSAMMVTGWLPPFESRRRDSAWWAGFHERAKSADPIIRIRDGGTLVPKDALRITVAAASGSNELLLLAAEPVPTPVMLCAGDWLWINRPWHWDSLVRPGATMRDWCYEVATDCDNSADPTQPVRVSIARAWQVAEVAATGADEQGQGVVVPLADGSGLQADAAAGGLVLRVASEADRRFARRVHEMMVRWTMIAGSENPQDFGAPRPANRQHMMDHPLAQFDCFFDAGARTADGVATRQPRNIGAPEESFYRWIGPRNPATGTHGPSHVGPGNHYDRLALNRDGTTVAGTVPWVADDGDPARRFDNWQALADNIQLREPSPGSDARRFHLARSFSAADRTRELVFWAVDWRSYQDAEEAPSAPLARARAGRATLTSNALWPVENAWAGSPLVGNPEMKRCWTSADRQTVLRGDLRYNSTWTRESIDTLLGHWGADRNLNQRLDRGPTAPQARIRATSIARFLYYDPILRLRVED